MREINFKIITFGCKVNWCESEAIHSELVKNQITPIENFEESDVVIINSCTVTEESNRKIKQKINRIKKINPKCTLILTGCMAEITIKHNNTIKNVDILIGNKSIQNVVNTVLSLKKNNNEIFQKNFENLSLNLNSKRTRAFLKIEDGCNRFCTYCIIPYARGNVRSKHLEEIKKDAENLAKNGYKEVVLVGINLSLYGTDFNLNLSDAVRTVCAVNGIERVRLSSLEPEILDEKLILKLKDETKLCPQFHLALQSGSNKILKKMGRKYTKEKYLEVVKNLKKYFKNVTFTTDLMVGFPGETEKDFEDSVSLISEVDFLKVHVFPYSVRPGTKAAELPNQISKKIKTERVKRILNVAEISRNKVLKIFSKEKLNVLFETKHKEEIYEGYTENYIPIRKKFEKDVRGKIILCEI